MADVNAVEEGNKVVLTGENPFIRLSDSPDGDETTNASFWRILFCPAGPGAGTASPRPPAAARAAADARGESPQGTCST